mgnify:CR=1 FL=1
MPLHKFAFLLKGDGLHPDTHRAVLKSADFEGEIIGVSSIDEATAVAEALNDTDTQLLEVCGGFGAEGTAAVLSVLRPTLPVGFVAYGPEATSALFHIFCEDREDR